MITRELKRNTNVEKLIIRPLMETDVNQVRLLDNESTFSVADILDIKYYSWGIFKDHELVGYCTIGYADCCPPSVELYPGWNVDNLLLSDVFVLQEYRCQGIASNMINSVLSLHPETKNNLIFLTLLDIGLQSLYRNLGFNSIDDGYIMVKFIK